MDKPLYSLTREERTKIMDENPPEVTGVHWASGYFDWTWKGCGFGQLSFSLDGDVLTCMNECMGRDSVRKLLHAYADFIADRVILDETGGKPDVPPIDFAAERAEQRLEHEKFEAHVKRIKPA